MRYEEIVDPVNKVIDEYTMRLTVRQIYYRLISPPFQLFAGSQQNYKSFDRLLTTAREREDVEWEKIEDRARQTIGGDFGYENPDAFLNYQISRLKECSEHYTRRMWDDQPYYVEVWVEKDALATLFSNSLQGFRVLTFPSRGYSSFTKIMEALTDNDRFPRYIKMGKPILILHYTDHDPSGLNMTEDINKRLYKRGYLVRALRDSFTNEELETIKGAYKGKEFMVRIQRYALTYEQVQQFNLAPNPTKKASQGRKWYIGQFGDKCWELDALPPDELQRIIRGSVEGIIDADAWNKTLKSIKEEQEKLKEKLGRLRIEFEEEGKSGDSTGEE
jgi:hypothetical protein